MANVCSSCSTDNADGALVCRQCGAALAPAAAWSRSLIPEDDTFDPLSAPTLVMQHTAPAALPDIEDTQPIEPEGSTGRRLVWGLAGFVVLLGAGVWLLRPSAELPAAVAPAPAAAASAGLPPASAALPASGPAIAASAVTLAPPPAPVPASEPAVAPAMAAPATSPSAPPASAADRRKRIPEPVVRRPVPASAPAAPPAEPAPAPPPSPPAPAPEPVRPRSVAELCAGSNLLTRGFCEHRECAKADLAGDPVCVRLKDAEEARRVRQ